MDSLWSELIQLIYSHLYIHKDSLRFSLVSKSIRAALPEEISILHKHHHTMMASLNEIAQMYYEIFDISRGRDALAHDSIAMRKCNNKSTTIYQIIRLAFYIYTYESTAPFSLIFGGIDYTLKYHRKYKLGHVSRNSMLLGLPDGLRDVICWNAFGINKANYDYTK